MTALYIADFIWMPGSRVYNYFCFKVLLWNRLQCIKPFWYRGPAAVYITIFALETAAVYIAISYGPFGTKNYKFTFRAGFWLGPWPKLICSCKCLYVNALTVVIWIQTLIRIQVVSSSTSDFSMCFSTPVRRDEAHTATMHAADAILYGLFITFLSVLYR